MIINKDNDVKNRNLYIAKKKRFYKSHFDKKKKTTDKFSIKRLKINTANISLKNRKINNLFFGYDMLFKCWLINLIFFCYIKYFHMVDAVKFSLCISLMYPGL